MCAYLGAALLYKPLRFASYKAYCTSLVNPIQHNNPVSCKCLKCGHDAVHVHSCDDCANMGSALARASQKHACRRHIESLWFANVANQLMWWAYVKAAWRSLLSRVCCCFMRIVRSCLGAWQCSTSCVPVVMFCMRLFLHAACHNFLHAPMRHSFSFLQLCRAHT